MAGHCPSLNAEALGGLRRLVRALHAQSGSRLPLAELAALTAQNLDVGVTVDFQASRELGEPMVVLRVPSVVPQPALAGLSPREREVASLVAAGRSNKEIARKLLIALATVKDHVHRILVKTSLPNRAAIAAAWCQREEIVSPGSAEVIPSLDGIGAPGPQGTSTPACRNSAHH
jgi:DNA-binding NarL/FixJ family response regulator